APGIIWAGKPSDGLYRWAGRNVSPLTSVGLSQLNAQINALLVARDGSCWVAGAHGLLHFKDPKAAVEDAELPVLTGFNVISLGEDRQGGIWAGTREGELWRLRNGSRVAETNRWQSHAITALAPTPDGSTWVGTEGGGLYRYKDGVRAHFDKNDGLLTDLIRTLYLDAQGTLWIGTAGGGLGRWHNGHITTFTTREGLLDDTISQILEDDTGRLWLGSNRGIACVSKRDLEELAAKRIPAVYPQVYGRAEGMLSEECTGGFCPAGLKAKSGLLWFSTLKGVVVVDPRPKTGATPIPLIAIEEMLVDGVAIDKQKLVGFIEVGENAGQPSGVVEPGPANPAGAPSASRNPSTTVQNPNATESLTIAPGKRRFEFHYTGLSFNAPERVRFRYWLEGLDPDWVEAGAQRTAFYSYVPPGNYRFRVAACNSDGIWNDAGASLAMTVLPHFWQAWWFLGLAGLGLMSLVAGTVRVVEKGKAQRRLNHLEQERALQRERARIAQDLHDDLGSSLARISLLSGLAKADKDNPDQLEIHVNKISQSANETVRALEEIVWAVRPGSDSLQSLVEYIAHFANELFADASTRCRLDLPHDLPARPLPPEVRHNIFLIVKEALTNVLRHASTSEVRVQAKASVHSLEIMVQDDGKGFDAPAPPLRGKRQGLGNMRHRAESINGTLAVESVPGKGTTVRLTVGFPGGTGAGQG
ncbi:MAG: two component regulator propeller/histidine kinase domain protein, partial [Pedosphaera sp.]|nr:two component regulator propeller/histidine kinase domain protein [Pedosphaera sp.]